MNHTLILEYLAAAKCLGTDSLQETATMADYTRANTLALRCMTELPAPMWERITRVVLSPDWQAVIQLAEDIRAEIHPHDPLDFARLCIVHAPGAGGRP